MEFKIILKKPTRREQTDCFKISEEKKSNLDIRFEAIKKEKKETLETIALIYNVGSYFKSFYQSKKQQIDNTPQEIEKDLYFVSGLKSSNLGKFQIRRNGCDTNPEILLDLELAYVEKLNINNIYELFLLDILNKDSFGNPRKKLIGHVNIGYHLRLGDMILEKFNPMLGFL